MDALIIESTLETPSVILDKEAGKFEISGKSLPEEAKKFYEPIYEWFENYVKDPNDKMDFFFKMDYYNSSTSTILLELLHMLDKVHKSGKPVNVFWYYLEVDDDMLEAGEEFEELVSMPFIYESMEETE